MCSPGVERKAAAGQMDARSRIVCPCFSRTECLAIREIWAGDCIFPFEVIDLVVLLLPAVQFVLRCSLNGGYCGNWTVATVLRLFSLFVVQGMVILLGRHVSCGCFGLGSSEIGISTISVPVACLIACAYLLIQPFRRVQLGNEVDVSDTSAAHP